MREKLHEHIIYLQNEVRKRDELLEGGSEFGGDDDFAPESDSASLHDDSTSLRNAMDSGSLARSSKQPAASKRRSMGQILKA